MNCFPYFHQNLFLQQQYINHQMLMQNQMLNAYAFLTQPIQPIHVQAPEQPEFLHSQNYKNEDTPLILPKNNIPLKRKIAKVPIKLQQKIQGEIKQQKKKVFLSMLDIKEAQYKKSKISNSDEVDQQAIYQNKIKE